jgi:hypothetical protein
LGTPVEVATFTGGGNVGIGTSAPADVLEVRAGSDANLAVRTGATVTGGTGVAIQALNDAASATVPLVLQGSVIELSGNVGIGVTPTSRFHIQNSGTSAYAIEVDASDGSNLFGVWEESDGTGQIYLRDASGNAQVLLDSGGDSYFTGGNVGIGTTGTLNAKVYIEPSGSGATNDGLAIGRASGGSAHYISNYQSNLRFGIDNGADGVVDIDIMTLQYDGNVGIATSSPNARLEVEDSGMSDSVLIKATADDNAVFGLVVGNDTYSTTDTDGLALSVGNSGEAFLNARGTGSILQLGTVGTERMRIDSSGNVVIGTGAISTSATDGFLYIPSMAGAPSGTPTDHSNLSAFCHDTTNNRLYVYDHVSNAWQYATLT